MSSSMRLSKSWHLHKAKIICRHHGILILELISCLIMNLSLLYRDIYHSKGFSFPHFFSGFSPSFFVCYLYLVWEESDLWCKHWCTLDPNLALNTDSLVALEKSPPLILQEVTIHWGPSPGWEGLQSTGQASAQLPEPLVCQLLVS